MMPKVNPPIAQPSSPTVLMMPPTRPISAGSGGPREAAEQSPQRGGQDQRVEAEIRGVERPARPHHEKDQPLIARDAAHPTGWCAGRGRAELCHLNDHSPKDRAADCAAPINPHDGAPLP